MGSMRIRLTRTEVGELNRSQFATGSQKHRDPRFLPLAFTEHSAIMAANVLSIPCTVRAIREVIMGLADLWAPSCWKGAA